MKKIIYMAMSLDGYISDKNNKTPWSDNEWKNYKNKVEEIKNIIIGHTTYKDMLNSNEFEKIGNPKVFIFTSKNIENYGNFIFVKNYKILLSELEKFSFEKILIAGGTKLNSYFLENDLVDELFLDVEPFIFGEGLKLFDKISENKNLELLKTKKYGKNSIQLHYKI